MTEWYDFDEDFWDEYYGAEDETNMVSFLRIMQHHAEMRTVHAYIHIPRGIIVHMCICITSIRPSPFWSSAEVHLPG